MKVVIGLDKYEIKQFDKLSNILAVARDAGQLTPEDLEYLIAETVKLKDILNKANEIKNTIK